MRWVESHHFPLTNLYESLIFLSWNLIAFLFFSQIKNKKNNSQGLLITPLAFFLNGFANFNLPTDMQKINSLIPALQSNWLIMHVTVMMISYTCLFLGSLFSLTFLIIFHFFSKKKKKNFLQKNLLNDLDELSFKLLSTGFFFITLGILSGALWANETWGSYWNWDPKESWSLITWITFAIYLHTRTFQYWKKENTALIASFGFFILWFLYLGLNFFGKGLHSYGWLVF